MLSTQKITLSAASLATAAALAVAVTKTPQTPFEEMNNAEKTEYLAKQGEEKQARTYTWNDKESVVSNVVKGAKTTGNIIAQGAEKTTDYPAPLTAALALELLGLGAAARSDKKKAQLKQQQEEKRIAYEQQQAREAEEAKKYEEARQAEIENEKLQAEQARLSELDATMAKFTHNLENFDFQDALSKFGVVDTKHPIKKMRGGLTQTASSNWGQIHTEYYMSKDGKIIEAGIKQRDVQGVDSKDYNYAYVRVVNPTIEGKVCELGRLHVTDEYGKVIEYNNIATVSDYSEHTNFSNPKPYRAITRNKSNRIGSRNAVVDIPEHEQLKRREIMRDAESHLITDGYYYKYDNNEHGEEEQKVRNNLFGR